MTHTLTLLALLWLSPLAVIKAEVKVQQLSAKDVFNYQRPVIFQDDFRSGLGKWKVTIDAGEDRSSLDKQTEKERVQIVEAPDSDAGRKAVRCVVPYKLGTFRSEITLPPEEGFHERWYGARIYVPKDWVSGSDSGGDTVMQWHGRISKVKLDSANPPLSIAILHDRWVVHQSTGPMDNINRVINTLDKTLEKGRWVVWVIHVRWSSGDDGLVEIWKDGKRVFDTKGPNTYLTKPVTPYFKTGIYHPKWKTKNEEKFKEEATTLTKRVIYTADVKIGNEHAKFEDVAPKP